MACWEAMIFFLCFSSSFSVLASWVFSCSWTQSCSLSRASAWSLSSPACRLMLRQSWECSRYSTVSWASRKSLTRAGSTGLWQRWQRSPSTLQNVTSVMCSCRVWQSNSEATRSTSTALIRRQSTFSRRALNLKGRGMPEAPEDGPGMVGAAGLLRLPDEGWLWGELNRDGIPAEEWVPGGSEGYG